DGTMLRISDVDKRKDWKVDEVAYWPEFPGAAAPGSYRLVLGDFDNSGSLDAAALGPRAGRVWLADAAGKFRELPAALPGRAFAADTLRGNGRLDLTAVSDAGQPARLENRGSKEYHW